MNGDSVIHLDRGNRWSAFKHLSKVINLAILTGSPKDVGELESLLRKHKPDFFSLLKNPPRSPLHKEVVVQSVKDGITVVQNSTRTKKILPKNVVEEALLMSEMFDLNELTSLELIITGENQVPRFPGAARGPVAVLLYFDARRSLLSSLKSLLQAVAGRSWSVGLKRDFNRLLTTFLKELIDNNVVDRALENLNAFDVKSEFDLLHRNRALGPGKFKRQVYEIIKEIKELYSYIVFAFAAQFDLKPSTTKKLVETIASKGSLESSGTLDSTSTMLVIGLYYIFDVSSLQSTEENTPSSQLLVRGDDDHRVPATNVPQVIKNRQTLKDIFQLVKSIEFSVPQSKNLVNFCLALTARAINSCNGSYDDITIAVDDERLLDECISEKIFETLDHLLARNPVVRSDEFFMLRLHCLFTDLPHLFPSKLKELRDRGDEEGRIVASNIQQGINPPASLNHHFQKYLLLLTDFYSEDTKGLSSNFWKSTEQLHQLNVDEKYVSFSKFIRSTLETYLPQNLRMALFKLLAAFAKTSPFSIFSLLRSAGSLHNPQFSFDEIFKTFDLYLKSFRGVVDKSGEFGMNFQSMNSSMPRQAQQLQGLVVTAMEIDVLCSILKMIETIVSDDKTCSISIAENQSYNCISVLIDLISCPVSRKLKSSLLSCLGGFCKASPAVALNVWSRMEVILPKPQVAVVANYGSQKNWTDGVYVEIEYIEPRSEEYPVTIGFLKLISNIVGHIICINESTKQTTLETAINFVVNGIFLKVNSRVFAKDDEKYTILSSCLEITHHILRVYDPIGDETQLKSSFSTLTQVLQENLFFRTLMSVIENASCVLQPDASSMIQTVHPAHTESDLNRQQESCLLLSLQVINQVIEKHGDFLTLVRSIHGFPSAALMSMATLFSNINPRTSEADRLATVVKVVSFSNPPIQVEAIKILRGLIAEETSISHLCLLQIQPFKKYHEDYILHGFVDSLESDHEELRIEVLKLIADSFQSDTSSTSAGYGLAHKILGFDRKLQLRVPGTFDQTFTCLHSIIATVEADLDPSLKVERSLCMKILLAICTNPGTCSNSLRFLRTSYDLMTSYLNNKNRMIPSGNDPLLPEVFLFWKLLATEIKTVVDSSLKSHCNNYIRLLLGPDGNKKLLELNPNTIFTHSFPEMPSWEYFDPTELWNTISQCSDNGIVDVKSLHSNILHEVRQFSSQLGPSQAGSIQTEIRAILSFACQLNESREEMELKISYFDGWRELIETILLTNSLDTFNESTRGVLILHLINELLEIASSPETITAILSPISSTILVATAVIRKMPSEVVSQSSLRTTASCLVNLLESPASGDTWNKLKRARVNLYATLLHLIRSLDSPVDYKLSYRLMDRLVKDSLTGIELVKVLAISIIAECDTSWVNELASDGSLRMLIESLVVDDKEIKASKCDKLSKSFYSFESKMMLFIKIASSQPGSRTLIHLGIVDCLLHLETFDMYSSFVNKNEVCFKIFSSVLKLILLLVDMSLPSDQEILAKFLKAKSHVIYDLMKTSPGVYRETDEGKVVVPQITALTSKLILFSDCQLQKTFISFTPLCCDLKTETDSQILTNVLQGCIRFMAQNPLTPLFVPSWDCRDNFMILGQPSLGLLIPIIRSSLQRLKQEQENATVNSGGSESNTCFRILIESSLYVIWHHLNLFSSAIELTDEESVAINNLQIKSPDYLNESLFGAIQSVIRSNTFVDATIRRINRIVNLGSS